MFADENFLGFGLESCPLPLLLELLDRLVLLHLPFLLSPLRKGAEILLHVADEHLVVEGDDVSPALRVVKDNGVQYFRDLVLVGQRQLGESCNIINNDLLVDDLLELDVVLEDLADDVDRAEDDLV